MSKHLAIAHFSNMPLKGVQSLASASIWSLIFQPSFGVPASRIRGLGLFVLHAIG